MIYITVQGDTFDQIAQSIYGDAKQILPLMEANPEHMGKIIFPAGVALQVPVLTRANTAAENLPPWRRSP